MAKPMSLNWMSVVAALVVYVLAGTTPGAAAGDATAHSRLAPEDEAIQLLSRYVQIDTTNPPGNEIEAARFFKQIFDREGIEARIIESRPGRGNVVARLKGNGAKKAVVLMNHMDVVPADAHEWKEPPFGGVVKNGLLWGRGALDMKGPGIIELMTLLAFKRQNASLKGDLIFLGTADEEAGGALGAGYLLKKHADLFHGVGLVVNEGGGIRLDESGKARFYSLGVAEKTPLWLRLTATGRAGHGSTPAASSAVVKLVAALSRIEHYRAPIKVIPRVQRYYADAAAFEPPERREAYRDLRKALRSEAFATEFTRDPRANAMVRNTIAVTMIKGSEKVNVIPAKASAELDIRLLPGAEPGRFIEELGKIIKDESIRVETTLSFPPATSPEHPEALKAIRQLARIYDGGVPVLAPLGRGFTDCHFFREQAIPCYGFIPLRSPARGENLVHGINERIDLERFRSALRMMQDLVRELVSG